MYVIVYDNLSREIVQKNVHIRNKKRTKLTSQM